MSPPPSRAARAVLLTLLAGLLTLLAPATARADDAGTTTPTPLTVRLAALSPAIPPHGRIVLRGVVRNSSDEEWRDINIHPIVSSTPMTSSAELAEAAALPETTDVGHRLTKPGTFASIGDLAPGQSTRFVIRLKRDDLQISGAPGVYWIGVHALGTDQTGRDGVADGRARAFIPLVPRSASAKGRHASVSVVLPLRAEVRRDVDGRILDADAWADALGEQGRLGRILGIAEGSGTAPYSWLIDPAVLDAASDLADGNPKLSYGTASPTPSPTAHATGASFRVTRSSADTAKSWLQQVVADASSRTVLGLPYADPDVEGLARLRAQMLTRAVILSAHAFQGRRLDALATYAPPDGYVAPEMWTAQRVPLVLGGDHGVALADDHRRLPATGSLVLADSAAASGGPLPTSATAALAERQRILSEAALRLLAGDTATMTVVLPEHWEPGPDASSAAFFPGLSRPWLRLVPLDTTAGPRDPQVGVLPYPTTERSAEIGTGQVDAARSLINAGARLAAVLDTDNDVLDRLSGAALAATSYAARTDPTLPDLVRSRSAALQQQLSSVRVLGTEFNTLSSGQGRLTVVVVNNLPQAVKLGLRVSSDAGLKVASPHDLLRIGPGQRQTVRLQATAENIGVHDVTLTPVTSQGATFGTGLRMTVRTSEVGRLIWWVLAVAGGLFVVMIIRRIVLRIRQHRWKPPVTEG